MPQASPSAAIAADLRAAASFEVTPKTLAKEADLRASLPAGRVVFIAHLAGTATADMVAAAHRLRHAGFTPKPHIPARLLRDRTALADLLARYQGEAGVDRALLLAGGVAQPAGDFDSSMDLVETGLFDAAGFCDLSFAGHPEGSPDISPAALDAALGWKRAYAERTDAHVSLVTQFVFDAAPVIDWATRLDLPVHVGLAGPAKLQTLIRYGLSCGVGPSLKVLQRRAGDLGRLLRPFTPDDILTQIAAHLATAPDSPITGIHMFPLGGIAPCADWLRRA